MKYIILIFTVVAFCSCGQKWEGFERNDFKYLDRDVIVVKPKVAAPGNPWIWRPAFFGAFANVDTALLHKGFHVVYYDLTHLSGSPKSIRLGNDFYDYIVQKESLSSKVVLEGFSRGGLFVFNWAAENPEKVACIYADAPVCNLLSWPGREIENEWKNVLDQWELEDGDMDTFNQNPINKAGILGKYKIPVISVCGDSDEVVPYEENMKIMKDSLLHYGSEVHLILKPGVGHHPHSLENPKEIVDFIVSKTGL